MFAFSENDTGSLRPPPSRSGTFVATSLMVALYRTYARLWSARSFAEAVAHLVALSRVVVPDSASKVTSVLRAIRSASWFGSSVLPRLLQRVANAGFFSVPA